MVQNFSATASFLWSVADLLRGDFKQSQYGRVILLFTLLRRLECVLKFYNTSPMDLTGLGETRILDNLDTYIRSFGPRDIVHLTTALLFTGQQERIFSRDTFQQRLKVHMDGVKLPPLPASSCRRNTCVTTRTSPWVRTSSATRSPSTATFTNMCHRARWKRSMQTSTRSAGRLWSCLRRFMRDG